MNRRLEMVLLGIAGGLAGLAARRVADRVRNRIVPNAPIVRPGEHRSWAIAGERHAPGEPPTEALARVVYEKIMHRAPSTELTRKLAKGAHRAFGLALAVLYAVTRDARHPPRTRSGIVFGAAVWAVGSELALPVLGFSEPPTAYRARLHLAMLADHLVYGAAVGATTQQLAKALPRRRRGLREQLRARMPF